MNPTEAKAANVPEPTLDPNLPHRSWRLSFVDGSTREQFTLPEASLTEVLALWPGTVAASPFVGRGDVASSHSGKIFQDRPKQSKAEADAKLRGLTEAEAAYRRASGG